MIKYLTRSFGLSLLLAFSLNGYAQHITVQYQSVHAPSAFEVAGPDGAAPVFIDASEDSVVGIAAGLFAADVQRLSGQTPAIEHDRPHDPVVIIAGTLGKNKTIDMLATSGKLKDIDKIRGKWEASLWQIVLKPTPGISKALVIVGSDRRGTAYGLLQLSRKMGVSPWYWWADAAVAHHGILTLNVPAPCYDAPAVKYRGVFINDEDWGLNQWARHNYEPKLGSIGPKTYKEVFELMLRLRLNYLWPAMHPCTKEFGSIAENWQLADKYGIVIGSSHCEPMLYNNVHWNEKLRGHWNYATNRDSIFDIWQKTTQERKNTESVWTEGIRGIHDRGMETPPKGINERIQVVENVFKDQRGLIDKYVTKKYGPVAQCFIPYKEVLPIYDAGLKVPDDVTLIWVDDNFGYIRRLSDPAERERSGGCGVYWHISYYGNPHSYTWINTTAPALIWEELHKAWENDARKMWVLNVGDIKPMEIGIDYYAKLAWNPDAQHATSTQPAFLKDFVGEHFDRSIAEDITRLLTTYYHLGTIRKPELMNRKWALGLSDKNAEALTNSYQVLLQAVNRTAKRVPEAQKDVYTELVGYPARILAATGLIFMHDRSAIYQEHFDGDAGIIDSLKAYINKQVDQYNNQLAGGKWKFMMPGMVTGKKLTAWNSQVAWPWGETGVPDTTKKAPVAQLLVPASSFSRQSNTAKAKWTEVPGLGNSGRALSLLPASLQSSWNLTDKNPPTLTYDLSVPDSSASLYIDFLPTFRIYPGMQLRVAVSVDGGAPVPVEVPGSNGKEDENGPSRNLGIRNNYVRAKLPLAALSKGRHVLSISALDPGVVIDRILLQ